MKNKTKKALCAASILGVVTISGIFAYLTDFESKENRFTIGNVDIEILEPAWEIDGETVLDENEDEIPDFAENIVPNQVLPKDPRIKNKGTTDAYVFMVVRVPVERGNAYKYNDDGIGTLEEHLALFDYEIDDDNWGLLKSGYRFVDEGVEVSERIYYYKGEALEAGEETPPLFEEVVVNNIEIKNADYIFPMIDILAMAIQSDEIPDSVKLVDGEEGAEGPLDPTDAEDYEKMMKNIYNICLNQNIQDFIPFNPGE